MLLVHAELETNRADFMQVWDYQQWEMRACKFLTDNRRDLKRIPSDTLASFDPVYGRIHFFHPRRDAFEVLKNSGLMSSVPTRTSCWPLRRDTPCWPIWRRISRCTTS